MSEPQQDQQVDVSQYNGMDAKEMIREIDAAVFKEKRAGLLQQVRYVHTGLAKAKDEKHELEKQLVKANKRVSRANAKIEGLLAGDWSVLKQDQRKPQNQPLKNLDINREPLLGD